MLNRPTRILNQDIRDRIKASALINRLQLFALDNPDKPRAIRMTRTQVHTALALLRKVIPDLASVEVSGNPEQPLMVQVVRFSDGEEISQARPVLEMGKLLEMERAETLEYGMDDGTANTSGLEAEQKQGVMTKVRRTQYPSNRKSGPHNGPKKRMRQAIRERAKAGR